MKTLILRFHCELVFIPLLPMCIVQLRQDNRFFYVDVGLSCPLAAAAAAAAEAAAAAAVYLRDRYVRLEPLEILNTTVHPPSPYPPSSLFPSPSQARACTDLSHGSFSFPSPFCTKPLQQLRPLPFSLIPPFSPSTLQTHIARTGRHVQPAVSPVVTRA
jgi:hypothetical protein